MTILTLIALVDSFKLEKKVVTAVTLASNTRLLLHQAQCSVYMQYDVCIYHYGFVV